MIDATCPSSPPPALRRTWPGLLLGLLALLFPLLAVAATAQASASAGMPAAVSVGAMPDDRLPDEHRQSAAPVGKRRVQPLSVEGQATDTDPMPPLSLLPSALRAQPQDSRCRRDFGWAGPHARQRQLSTRHAPPGHAPPRA